MRAFRTTSSGNVPLRPQIADHPFEHDLGLEHFMEALCLALVVSDNLVLDAHAHRGILQAEREGFEPSVQFDPHTAFPVPYGNDLSGFFSTLTACESKVYEKRFL